MCGACHATQAPPSYADEDDAMTRGKLFWIIPALLSLALVACNHQTKEVKNYQGEASRDLGEAYMQEGNYSAALRELLKAEKSLPKDPFVQNDLGLVYMAKNRPDLSVPYFKKAIALNPDYAPARNNLGTAYLALKKWDLAIETFQSLSEDLLYASPHLPLTNLGWAYFNKRDFPISVKYYKAAIHNNPKFVPAYRGLGQTYLAMNRFAEAIESFEKGLEIAPRFAPLYLNLADAYTASQNRPAAIETYKKVIALFPSTEYAETAKQMLGD
jgi:Tfp pilus assembly protein PilF